MMALRRCTKKETFRRALWLTGATKAALFLFKMKDLRGEGESHPPFRALKVLGQLMQPIASMIKNWRSLWRSIATNYNIQLDYLRSRTARLGFREEIALQKLRDRAYGPLDPETVKLPARGRSSPITKHSWRILARQSSTRGINSSAW